MGFLPESAPLGIAYVPMQSSASPSYNQKKALSAGTLFPGLDYPFMNVVNPELPVTPLNELMAIEFTADELSLYLDTHAEDAEAFAAYQAVLALREEARRQYVRRFGPLCKADLAQSRQYNWLCSPWPWEKPEQEG